MRLTQQLAQNSQTAAPLFNLIKPVTDEIKQEEADNDASDTGVSNADRSTAALTASAFAGEAEEKMSGLSPSQTKSTAGTASKSTNLLSLPSHWMRV